MKRTPFALAIAFGVAAAPAAHAEFRIHAPAQDNLPVDTAPSAPGRIPPRVKPAYSPKGFGDGVPLRVAAEQIVPPGTKVDFAPEVNPDAEVTWRGRGRAWWVVLDEAVKGFHWKVQRTPGAVRITQ